MTGDRAGMLERIDALHIALTQLVLEGGDLDQIAQELARVLDVGVAVTSTDGRERASALTDATRGALTDAGLFDPTGRLRVEEIALGDAPQGGDYSDQVRMVKVMAGGTDLARLTCVRVNGRCTTEDVQAMERASAVAALLITRQEAIAAVENKYQGDFLRDVFSGRAGAEADVVAHGTNFGWSLNGPMLVIAAEIDRGSDEAAEAAVDDRRRWQSRFVAAWRQVTEQVDPHAPVGDFSSEVVVVLPVREQPVADVVRRLVREVAGDRGGGRRPFSVGLGRVSDGVPGLGDSYSQARRALDVGRRVKGASSTTWFDQLGLQRLLALVPDVTELRAFAHDVLGELAGSDTDTIDLRHTLQVLIDTNFNVAEAARVQFFHYNTMRYRVAKLERMLGPVTTDPHLRLDVAVALKALEVSDTSG